MTSIKGVLFLKNVDGEMKWVNGDSGNEGKYEGEYKDGKMDGIGTYTFGVGGWWTGEFKGDKPWNIIKHNMFGKIIGKYVSGVKQ